MRRLQLGSLVFLGLVLGAVPAAAQSARLFSAVDKSIVAVGETLVHQVEVYATGQAGEADRLADLLSEAVQAEADEAESAGLELVSNRVSPAEPARLADGMPAHIARVHVEWRSRRAGPVLVPAMEVVSAGRVLRTASHQVMAYRTEPGLFQTAPSVVRVQAERRGVRAQRHVRAGSAFLLTPDALVTSLHVVMDARRVRVMLPDGRRLTTRHAWAIDPVRDLAVLHVDAKAMADAGVYPLTPAPLRPGGRTGSDLVAFTYGWPKGRQLSTAGRIHTGVALLPGEAYWISTNPVRPGDSGGPLLDLQGRVLGVVTSGTVGAGTPGMLREEVCVATDFRPILARLQGTRKPQRLSGLLRETGPRDEPHVLALRASTLLATGRYHPPELRATLDRLDARLRSDPEHAQLHFMRGMIYQMLGTSGAAVTSYRTALEVFEDHFLAAYMLGLHYLQEGRYEAAERMLRFARSQPPYARHATYGLARALMGQHRYAEAIRLLRSIVAFDASYAPAYFDLGRSELAQGNEEAATLIAAKLVLVDPVWAGRLHRVLREPALRPIALRPLPRAAVRLPGPPVLPID